MTTLRNSERSSPSRASSRDDSTVSLLQRASSGDREALEDVLARYLPRLNRWARGRLPVGARDLLNTEDLVQETLLKTVRRIEAFEPDHSGAFAGYLRQALANRIKDELRRVQRRALRETLNEANRDPAPSPLEEAVGRQTLARYERALESLPEASRNAVVARIEMGLSYTEVADLVGKPSGDAARMTVNRSLLAIARVMARD